MNFRAQAGIAILITTNVLATPTYAQGNLAKPIIQGLSNVTKGKRPPGFADLKKSFLKWRSGSKVSTVALVLAPSKDYCPLRRDKDDEKAIYVELDKVQLEDARVVQFSVPCREVSTFLKGSEPMRRSVYIVDTLPVKSGTKRTDIVVDLSKEHDKFEILPPAKDKKAARPPQIKSGMIEANSEAFYLAGLVDDVTPPLAHVNAISLVGSHLVSLNFFAPYKDKGTFDLLLKDAQSAIANTPAATK